MPPHTYDSKYFWNFVTFAVHGRLFCVPDYRFLNESEQFAVKFSLFQGESSEFEYDFASDAATSSKGAPPTVVNLDEDVEDPDMFQTFLKALYPMAIEDEDLTKSEWVTILNLSSKWHFDMLRQKAIHALRSAEITPVEKILLGRQFGIEPWVLDGYQVLVRRREWITRGDAELIGCGTAVELYILRERLRGEESEGVILDGILDAFEEEFRGLRGAREDHGMGEKRIGEGSSCTGDKETATQDHRDNRAPKSNKAQTNAAQKDAEATKALYEVAAKAEEEARQAAGKAKAEEEARQAAAKAQAEEEEAKQAAAKAKAEREAKAKAAELPKSQQEMIRLAMEQYEARRRAAEEEEKRQRAAALQATIEEGRKLETASATSSVRGDDDFTTPLASPTPGQAAQLPNVPPKDDPSHLSSETATPTATAPKPSPWAPAPASPVNPPPGRQPLNARLASGANNARIPNSWPAPPSATSEKPPPPPPVAKKDSSDGVGKLFKSFWS